jgi:hypothetical protein
MANGTRVRARMKMFPIKEHHVSDTCVFIRYMVCISIKYHCVSDASRINFQNSMSLVHFRIPS